MKARAEMKSDTEETDEIGIPVQSWFSVWVVQVELMTW